MDSPPPSLWQRIQEKLAASRFLAFSLLLHLLLVVVGGTAVLVHEIGASPDFEAEGGGGLLTEESSNEPPQPEQSVTQAALTPPAPEIAPPQLEAIAVNTPTPASFQLAPPAMSQRAPVVADAMREMAKLSQAALGSGAGRLPSTMAGRAGGAARATAMQKNGGKEKSEKAVLAGLRWLKKSQNKDGSWSRRFPAAMTGFAVLCFLGHGETPNSMEFGDTVKHGIDWLVKLGKANKGNLGGGKEFIRTGVYDHAIACYALGEYYTMTRDEQVKSVLTEAIAYITAGQCPDGGWKYFYALEPDSDTSVTGWQIQALKAAHLTGLNLPGVDAALDKAMIDLQRVQGPKGGFGYRDAEDKYSLTGVGVLCTCVWRGERDGLAQQGIKFLLEKTEKEFPVKYDSETANLYAWYYNTQACLMFGGAAWMKWNAWFQDPLVAAQSSDGSWPPTKNPAANGPETDATITGQTYRTVLCVLMLEVYYRYMPSNR